MPKPALYYVFKLTCVIIAKIHRPKEDPFPVGQIPTTFNNVSCTRKFRTYSSIATFSRIFFKTDFTVRYASQWHSSLLLSFISIRRMIYRGAYTKTVTPTYVHTFSSLIYYSCIRHSGEFEQTYIFIQQKM